MLVMPNLKNVETVQACSDVLSNVVTPEQAETQMVRLQVSCSSVLPPPFFFFFFFRSCFLREKKKNQSSLTFFSLFFSLGNCTRRSNWYIWDNCNNWHGCQALLRRDQRCHAPRKWCCFISCLYYCCDIKSSKHLIFFFFFWHIFQFHRLKSKIDKTFLFRFFSSPLRSSPLLSSPLLSPPLSSSLFFTKHRHQAPKVKLLFFCLPFVVLVALPSTQQWVRSSMQHNGLPMCYAPKKIAKHR